MAGPVGGFAAMAGRINGTTGGTGGCAGGAGGGVGTAGGGGGTVCVDVEMVVGATGAKTRLEEGNAVDGSCWV